MLETKLETLPKLETLGLDYATSAASHEDYQMMRKMYQVDGIYYYSDHDDVMKMC